MRMVSSIVLLLVLAAAGMGTARAEDAVQGKWVIVSLLSDGKPVENMVGAVREVANGKYALTPKAGERVTGTYTVDNASTPKVLDMVADAGRFKGKTLKGIYTVVGDKLTICFAAPDKPRPTTFASTLGSGVHLAVHQRVK